MASRTPIFNVVSPSEIIADEEIKNLGSQGLLITQNFEANQVHQTCYELRVGEVAYFLLRKDVNRKIEVNRATPILMRPGDVVTIITYEEVQLPDNILGRIISKGHLFSIGLSPVITFVDPGFSGKLGITFINHSKKNVKFRYKESICKIEFEKLGKNVKNPYRGQYNYSSEIWPLDFSKFVENRKIDIDQILNNDFLRKEAEFFGEPFDIITESIIELKNKINKSNKVITSLLYGIIIYVSLSMIFNVYDLLPGNIRIELASGGASVSFIVIKYILEKVFKDI